MDPWMKHAPACAATVRMHEQPTIWPKNARSLDVTALDLRLSSCLRCGAVDPAQPFLSHHGADLHRVFTHQACERQKAQDHGKETVGPARQYLGSEPRSRDAGNNRKQCAHEIAGQQNATATLELRRRLVALVQPANDERRLPTRGRPDGAPAPTARETLCDVGSGDRTTRTNREPRKAPGRKTRQG